MNQFAILLHFSPFFFVVILSQALAKEIVRSRRTVNRLYENKAQMNSISMHLGESVGMMLNISKFTAFFLVPQKLIHFSCCGIWYGLLSSQMHNRIIVTEHQICIKSIIVKIKIKILHGSVTSFGSEMNRRVKASVHNTERELFQSIYSI